MGPDRSALHQRRDLLEVLDVVLHAEVDGTHAGVLGGLLVDLADQGDEHSAALEHAPGSRLRLSAQRIEHHVDVVHLLFEALALVVDDRIDPERSQVIETRRACGGCHLGALPPRELRRE